MINKIEVKPNKKELNITNTLNNTNSQNKVINIVSIDTSNNNTNSLKNYTDESSNETEEISLEEYTISTSRPGLVGTDGTKYYIQPDGTIKSIDGKIYESSIERYEIGKEYSSLLDVAEASGVSLNVILQANKDIINDSENLENGLIIDLPKDTDKLETLEIEYEESLADAAKNFKKMGVVENYNGHRITWYSEKVLPGGGLDIPGRHTDINGIVRDEDEYVCVMSGDYEKETIVSTNLGYGKVYDCGCSSGTIDIYTNW